MGKQEMKNASTYPLLEVCWLAGAKAYYNGDEEIENPYPVKSREADYWQDGWWEACMDEGDLAESLSQHNEVVVEAAHIC